MNKVPSLSANTKLAHGVSVFHLLPVAQGGCFSVSLSERGLIALLLTLGRSVQLRQLPVAIKEPAVTWGRPTGLGSGTSGAPGLPRPGPGY